MMIMDSVRARTGGNLEAGKQDESVNEHELRSVVGGR